MQVNERERASMPQAHIWAWRALQPAALAVLEGLASVYVTSVGERNDWYEEASKADVIIVSGEMFVTGEVMDRIGPRLRIIARAGIGVDRIDLDAAARRGILVVNSPEDRKSTRLNSSHSQISYAVFCLKKKKKKQKKISTKKK